jgi:hypothetical protein
VIVSGTSDVSGSNWTSSSGRQTSTSRLPFSRRVSTSPLLIRRCRVRVEMPRVTAASSTLCQA